MGFTFSSASPTPDSGTNNQWTFTSIAVGGSETITITGTVSASASGTLTNVATVNSDTTDPNTENDEVYEETGATILIYTVDVVAPSGQTVPAGTTVSYTFTVTNTGNTTNTFSLSLSGNSWFSSYNQSGYFYHPGCGCYSECRSIGRYPGRCCRK